MKLIVGLGNPGFRYRSTRHNIGFMILDNAASGFRIRLKERIFNSLCGRGRVGNEEVLFFKPLTYMNLSGKAVSGIRDKEDIPLKDLLIIMDDIDLALGRIRLRPRGSSGGHKGLSSIIEELETEEFPRLRVGIGQERKEAFLKDYVLAPFKRSERKTLDDLIERCALCVETWIGEGIDAAMRKYNPTKLDSL